MRGRRTGLAALLILLALAFAARIQAQTGYGSIYGFDQASYQSWVDEVAKTSRIVYVSAYDDGKQSRYIALNLPQRLGPRWELHTDLSEAEFKKKNSEYHDKGYYPTCVTGYLKGNVPHFGGIWVKDRKHSLHVALINLKEQDLFALLQNDKIKGSYLPEIIVGYADGNGSYRFAVLRVPAGKTAGTPS